MLSTFSYQIDVFCRDEIVAFVYRKPVEEPVNLWCRMRVNHALNFRLQPRPRVDDGARNFDFWCNWNEVKLLRFDVQQRIQSSNNLR